MTICLSTICNKGEYVIMIADSMITGEQLSIEFEQRTPKISKLSDHCVVSTAGNALVHTELFDAVRDEIENLRSPLIKDIVSCIKSCYVELRQRDIRERILSPRGFPTIEYFYQVQNELVREVALTVQSEIDSYEYGLDVLVAGVDSKGAHIFHVLDPGTSFPFDSIGYHAIGSGESHAITTLIANEYHKDFDLPNALLLAYRAKKVAERAPGVGSKITNIAIVHGNNVKLLTSEEVQQLDKIYLRRAEIEGKWKQEQSLGKDLKTLVQGLVK